MNEDSDLDLLVIMPDGTHRRRTAGTLYMKLSDVPVPIDFTVSTESDLRKHGEN
ncbi:MAG: hypothetical protein ACE15F_16385 [bacterium]